MQKNELRQMKAFMQKTKKDKLVMHISLNEFELEHYLLQNRKTTRRNIYNNHSQEEIKCG